MECLWRAHSQQDQLCQHEQGLLATMWNLISMIKCKWHLSLENKYITSVGLWGGDNWPPKMSMNYEEFDRTWMILTNVIQISHSLSYTATLTKPKSFLLRNLKIETFRIHQIYQKRFSPCKLKMHYICKLTGVQKPSFLYVTRQGLTRYLWPDNVMKQSSVSF